MLTDNESDVKQEDAPMAMTEPFTLTSNTMGCLPVLNHFLARIGLSRLQNSGQGEIVHAVPGWPLTL